MPINSSFLILKMREKKTFLFMIMIYKGGLVKEPINFHLLIFQHLNIGFTHLKKDTILFPAKLLNLSRNIHLKMKMILLNQLHNLSNMYVHKSKTTSYILVKLLTPIKLVLIKRFILPELFPLAGKRTLLV